MKGDTLKKVQKCQQKDKTLRQIFNYLIAFFLKERKLWLNQLHTR